MEQVSEIVVYQPDEVVGLEARVISELFSSAKILVLW